MYRVISVMTVGLLVFLMACGGNSNNNGAGTSPPVLKLNLTTTNTLSSQGVQFSANVPVTWTVKENNGGTITSDGLYTAPLKVGAYHVIATAVSDKSKTATATVNVSAKYAFIEELVGGQFPQSVTPIIGTLAQDGSVSTQNVIDNKTNQPVDMRLLDIAISPDGSKGGFSQWVSTETADYQAVWTANVDGSSLLQVSPADPTIRSEFVTFTPDGKNVLYVEEHTNEQTPSSTTFAIVSIDVDGTNKQTIFAGEPTAMLGTILNPWIAGLAVSPDGKKLAMEMLYVASTVPPVLTDGIATMSITGTDLAQLTGTTSCPASAGWNDGWDETPTFSPDGASIFFARYCYTDTTQHESVMNIALDGTNLKPVNEPAAGLISCQPRALADKIVFSSNMDNPATDWFDLYTMETDGSNVQRIINNQLYDAFNIWWMNPNATTTPGVTSARGMARLTRMSAMQQRLDHMKMHKDIAKK